MSKLKLPILSKGNKRLYKALRFLILLNIFSIPLYIILIFGLSFYPLQKITAVSVSSTLNLIGIGNDINGLSLSLSESPTGFMGTIDWDCTGWKSMIAFAALILATNESRRKKMIGLALLPLVYIANIIRITFVFAYVAYFGIEYFEFIHSLMFSFAMIAFILALWLAWLKYFNVKEKKVIATKRNRRKHK